MPATTRSPTALGPVGRNEPLTECCVTTSSTSPMSWAKTRWNFSLFRPCATATSNPSLRKARVTSAAVIAFDFESRHPARQTSTTAMLQSRRTAEDFTERLAEELVLRRCSNGDADRARCAESPGGADDHPLAEELLEERPRILADLREQEVRDGLRRVEIMVPHDPLELDEAVGIHLPAAR